MEKSNRSETALAMFSQGYNCAQSVVAAYCDETGMDKGTALKVAASFGGGMARMGQTCGALTGAFMVLGLKCASNIDAKDKFYAMVNEFTDKFKAMHGQTITCPGLLGCDIKTAEGKQKSKAVCHGFVKDAVELIEGIS